MTTRRSIRKITIFLTAAALLVSGIALPAAARPKAERGPKVEHSQRSKDQSKAKNQHQRGKSAEAKARKAARFQATGALLAVDGTTISVAVKGGPVKFWRGAIIDFEAGSARINRDDARATLAALAAGDHVAVKGMREDGVLVAKRVNAASPDPVVEEPTETVTDQPTETVTDQPTETVTDQPTETVTDEPTETVAP